MSSMRSQYLHCSTRFCPSTTSMTDSMLSGLLVMHSGLVHLNTLSMRAGSETRRFSASL